MFSNRRIGVSLGRTVNLGNFESLRIDIEISADVNLEKGEELKEYQDALFIEAKAELDSRIDELVPKPSKPARGRLTEGETGYVP